MDTIAILIATGTIIAGTIGIGAIIITTTIITIMVTTTIMVITITSGRLNVNRAKSREIHQALGTAPGKIV
ncbi:hypothetical protein [Neorhizobium sp. P12A]|uniref:hypothetical protein n=1 Tax=Neorhizobium sp. P12A TaxID=2268027 RepID=UPI00165D51F2|nr:hypothetical protein [Neorhizobium sp. P12A]